MKKADFILISKLDDELARSCLFQPAHTIEEALAMAFAKLGPNPSVILMPQGSLTCR